MTRYSAILLVTLALAACGKKETSDSIDDTTRRKAVVTELLRPAPARDNYYAERADSMPPGGDTLHIEPLGGSLAKVFNDSNYVQMQVAEQIGILPINSSKEAWHTLRPMDKIVSGKNYYVDRLTHSLPYLIPEASSLLDEIGQRFAAKLGERGGGHYRIKVTSVLRTPATISSLKRRNVNAVERSTHLYGTTFDISYSEFIWDQHGTVRTQEDLKNLLGEVLKELRDEGRCYVKYERKQACYHITARS